METAAPAARVTMTTRQTHIRLDNAAPLPSWPALSGNTFTPVRLTIEVSQTFPDGELHLDLAVRSDPGNMLERWWTSASAVNGPHDARHLPAAVRDLVVAHHPEVAHLVSPS